jgi:hypothetical protein
LKISRRPRGRCAGDETERAYRGDALDKRRALMDAWAEFLTQGVESNVVPLPRRMAG